MDKYKLFWRLIIFGFILSLVVLFSLFPDCNNVGKILLQLVSSLGNGIFASAIVSLLIEYGNDCRAKQKSREQRECLLSDIRSILPNLLCKEIQAFSEYVVINSPRKKEHRKETFPALIECANKQLALIREGELARCEEQKVIVIDENRHKERINKERLFFDEALPYYERLKRYLISILEKKELYLLNGLLNKSNLEELQDFLPVVEDLISNCVKRSMDYTLDAKKSFLDGVEKLWECVSVDKSQTYYVLQYVRK